MSVGLEVPHFTSVNRSELTFIFINMSKSIMTVQFVPLSLFAPFYLFTFAILALLPQVLRKRINNCHSKRFNTVQCANAKGNILYHWVLLDWKVYSAKLFQGIVLMYFLEAQCVQRSSCHSYTQSPHNSIFPRPVTLTLPPAAFPTHIANRRSCFCIILLSLLLLFQC